MVSADGKKQSLVEMDKELTEILAQVEEKLGKKYELTEMSARTYQDTMDALEKKLGKDWQQKGSIHSGIILLGASMQDADGKFISEDELWKLSIRLINKLSAQMAKINGLDPDSREKIAKN